MAKVITFSRTFPSYHPRAGEPTHFIEKFWKSFQDEDGMPHSFHRHIDDCKMLLATGPFEEYKKFFNELKPKNQTIRGGQRWKVGDWFSPRVWSGKPYNSKQIAIGPDIQVKKVWYIGKLGSWFNINGKGCTVNQLDDLIENDGLGRADFFDWFSQVGISDVWKGQIICWKENIEY